MTNQETKRIKKAKDLEGVKPTEEVKLTYYYGTDPLSLDLPCTSKTTFGGSFNINDDAYLVFYKTKNSENFSGKYILSSELYKIQEDRIINDSKRLSDYSDKDAHSLEETVKRQTKLFRASKVVELKANQNKE